MEKSKLIFNIALVPFDFVMLMASGITTYFLRTKILDVFRPVLFEFNLPFSRYFILVLAVSLFFIATYALLGLYSLKNRRILEEFFKILIGSSAGIMAIIVYIFFRQELFDSRFLVLGGWLFSVLFVALGRLLMRKIYSHAALKYGLGVQKIMIIGNDGVSEKISRNIINNPAYGYKVVKRLANPEIEEIKSAVGNPGVHGVILAKTDYSAEDVVKLVDFCHENHLAFKFVPNLHQTLTSNYSFDSTTGFPLMELSRTALYGWGKVIKRLFDVFASFLGIILLSPLFLVIAFVIKWETAGSVFVRLKRISRNREFYLLKFRSMIRNAEDLKHKLKDFNERGDGPLFKIKNDPRITKTGRFLRKYRLDELPQLFNVIRGDMSLVGPRPHQPDEISKYEKRHKKVLAIKAGATGMAQISGSSDLPFVQEVNMDVFYIENWSLFLDFKIIAKTAFKMFFDRSAV